MPISPATAVIVHHGLHCTDGTRRGDGGHVLTRRNDAGGCWMGTNNLKFAWLACKTRNKNKKILHATVYAPPAVPQVPKPNICVQNLCRATEGVETECRRWCKKRHYGGVSHFGTYKKHKMLI